ncbi:MAG: hypothetical protein ABIJ46_04040 [bacterium]
MSVIIAWPKGEPQFSDDTLRQHRGTDLPEIKRPATDVFIAQVTAALSDADIVEIRCWLDKLAQNLRPDVDEFRIDILTSLNKGWRIFVAYPTTAE